MNHNEEVPDFLGEFLRPDGSKRPEVERGDMLPADVLKKVNELLEQLHRKDKEHQGSPVINIYESGSQHIDHQYIFGDKVLGMTKKKEEIALPSLPDVLRTDKAMTLWKKAQAAGWIDDNYQPKLSRTQAALMAHYIAKKLEIKDKWKTFEMLWNRRNMYRDYYDAMNQDQTYLFLDKLKELFE